MLPKISIPSDNIYKFYALFGLAMIFACAMFLNKVRHPATYLAIAVNISVFFMQQLGQSEILQSILQSVIKA